MSSSQLRVSTGEGVARIVFDRSKSRNALSPSMLRDLIVLSEELGRDDTVRVVLLQGAGNCFSAGADLPMFLMELGKGDAHPAADLGRRATEAVGSLPQTTIAAIQGYCVGGGVVLAGACDIRLAAHDARFQIPELEAGIPLAWGGLAHLVRLVGETVAVDWVLSARRFDADEALRAGLISRAVAPDRLANEAERLATSIAAKPGSVLRTTKRQLLAIRAGTFDARTDADALLAALRDPEAMKTAIEYMAERRLKRS
jgi:enoyl-CoA hydratase/carnithine racemase